MNHAQKIVLSAAAALIVGCAHSNAAKHAAAQPCGQAATANGSCENATATAAAPAPAVAPDTLAGTWQLAMPRHNTQQATITATDATHVTIAAGDSLSGNYVVKGEYLLILTRDEHLRPLAWKINSADSLTVVRPPDGDTADYTGVTLVRAASDSTASAADEAGGDDAQASTEEATQD